jgi:hypothetical protein
MLPAMAATWALATTGCAQKNKGLPPVPDEPRPTSSLGDDRFRVYWCDAKAKFKNRFPEDSDGLPAAAWLPLAAFAGISGLGIARILLRVYGKRGPSWDSNDTTSFGLWMMGLTTCLTLYLMQEKPTGSPLSGSSCSHPKDRISDKSHGPSRK